MKLKIAFDVDDTLIIPSVVTGNRDVPNYETIEIFNWFSAQGNDMIVRKDLLYILQAEYNIFFVEPHEKQIDVI
jgi:hypothetical protein